MSPQGSAATSGAAGVPLIEISGTPRNRGRAHGEIAREQVRRSLDHYREAFVSSSALAWPDVLAKARRWRPVIAAAAPHLLEEMDGIAEGAGLHPDEILALNARGEIVRSNDSSFATLDVDEASEGCSSFALLPEATPTGHVYCGQNWDWLAPAEPTTLMVRIVQPPRPTVIMQVEAGQVGRHGANSAGLALNANGLDGAFGNPPGLLQPVVRRLILDSATLNDALAVPWTVRQHIAANLLITHRDGIAIDLETTPDSHTWGYPRDGVLAHGNHYQYGTPPALQRTCRLSSPDSLFRVPIIERRLRAVRTADSPEAVRAIVKDTMSDHFSYPTGVCCHLDRPEPAAPPPERGTPPNRVHKTIMSSLVDLTAGEYRVLRGNPCQTEYSLLPWNISDGPAGPIP